MPYKDIEKRRQYGRDYMLTWYPANKERHLVNVARNRKKHSERCHDLVAQFKLVCVRCGERHPALLDFHHRDGSTKDFAISNAVHQGKYTLKRIVAELEKCDVLCCRCHRLLHWEEKKSREVVPTWTQIPAVNL